MAKDGKKNSSCDSVSKGKTKLLQAKLTENLGGTYASSLSIDLASMEADEVFKWLIASLILSSRISENIAWKIYQELESTEILTVEAVLKTGRSGLVRIMSRSGCVQHALAVRIEDVTKALKEEYEGDLNRLHFFAKDARDLERKLLDLGKGIRLVTVIIFLRELRGLWDKANPPLSQTALIAARNLGLTKADDREECLRELCILFDKNDDGVKISDIEVALVRLGKKYCRRKYCSICPMKDTCSNIN